MPWYAGDCAHIIPSLPCPVASLGLHRLHANCCARCSGDAGIGGTATTGERSGAAAAGDDSSAIEDAVYGGEEPDVMGEPLCDGAGRDGDAACHVSRCKYERDGSWG